MNELFPRTTVGGISLSRMLIGTNWILGWSHTSLSADAQIKETHRTPATIEPMLEVALDHGVDSIMGLFNTNPALNQAIANVEQRRGKKNSHHRHADPQHGRHGGGPARGLRDI